MHGVSARTCGLLVPWPRVLGELEEWRNESTIDDSGLLVPCTIELAGLLDHGDDKVTLGSLFVEKPMLSIHEDNIVCFMPKQDIMHLQGVSPLGNPLVVVGRATTLFYSTISSHLNNVAAAASTGNIWMHA